jgi:hypothetical protein
VGARGRHGLLETDSRTTVAQTLLVRTYKHLRVANALSRIDSQEARKRAAPNDLFDDNWPAPAHNRRKTVVSGAVRRRMGG